jgi:hypothetical protein
MAARSGDAERASQLAVNTPPSPSRPAMGKSRTNAAFGLSITVASCCCQPSPYGDNHNE